MTRGIKRRYKNVKLKENFTLEDLYEAYFACRKKKRNKQTAIEFEFMLESNMAKLYDELKNKTYKIGKSSCFVVLKPKPREIWAASFRDRIVHHLVYNCISERFLSHFIFDIYSCIKERGTYRAGLRAKKFAASVTNSYTKKAYYLKADIKNFFVSIDKNILYNLVVDRVPEIWLQELIKQIIFNNPKENAEILSPKWKFDLIPKHKSLWNNPNDRGLPIGNLTSQFFSNIYLNKLDQFVKHKLKCKYYCRYVDDFLIMDESPKKLNFCYKEIEKFLNQELKLELNKNKKTINLVSNGIDFVGYKIMQNRIFLRQKTIKKIFGITNEFRKNIFDVKEDELESLYATFNSYLGQLRPTNGYNLRKKLCEIISFPYFLHDNKYTKIKKMYVPMKYWKYIGGDETLQF